MIAVTGITGHSGKFFLKQLIDNDYPGALRCLVRASSDTSALDASGLNIEKLCGSIDSDADLERFVRGADTVVHIAEDHRGAEDGDVHAAVKVLPHILLNGLILGGGHFIF